MYTMYAKLYVVVFVSHQNDTCVQISYIWCYLSGLMTPRQILGEKRLRKGGVKSCHYQVFLLMKTKVTLP
jgi:hypothetical protein